MPAIVNSVIENSIAEELEIQKGDEILSIDGCEMLDMIDYNFLCKNELITLENTYQMFRRFDEYDFLTLLEAKIYQNVLNQVQREILAVCDHLMRFNKEE